MLTGIQVVFLGGDARQLEVIQKLYELDANIQLIGFDNLQRSYSGVRKADLTEEVLSEADAVILPVVGTDDTGKVEAIFSSQELRLEERHVAALPKHAKVYTGMAKPFLTNLCGKHGIPVVELLDRDDVAIYNSIPTAEGAVMIAIQNTDITIHGSTCTVIGIGRTGLTLARTLKGLGANVKVGVRRNEHFARAVEMGVTPFHTDHLAKELRDVDIVFNTVPAQVLTAGVIAQLPPGSIIIDLASKPGGTDFRFAERRGIKAMLAPGLPGMVAPKTAGRIIANAVSELILTEAKKRGMNR
ncbi:dipicolinate synthase subunit DpsA [Paenibacillus turpanensis]|uniref:dipicolinate synthase subunit DpsA n=1 Tax=Paenibacillus turpanensis TaxID=2689078 RepID=UPI00140C0B76|nr:dipicolinate synthase subunit DpsA [Paenibacillus turpanensis]